MVIKPKRMPAETAILALAYSEQKYSINHDVSYDLKYENMDSKKRT